MISEKIDLYAHFGIERGENKGGYLYAVCREQMGDLAKKSRPAMLVVPGGGYCMVSAREGEPVAMRFLGEGYATFTLDYSVGCAYPVPLIEGAMALVYIREQAERYSVDPQHVGAVGFSAGGHLTGMLATLFDAPAVREALGGRASLVRPDAVILCYAVLTTGVGSHGPTAHVISGGDKALRERLSLERRITADSSPAFIWHTVEDEAVPVENSLLYAAACREHGVPFELHIFEKGWHGASVASLETETSQERVDALAHTRAWIPLALAFLKGRGFAVRPV